MEVPVNIPASQAGWQLQNMPLRQAKSRRTFHRYLDLPFELRAPIRAFAIQAAIPTRLLFDRWPGDHAEDSLSCSRLAHVSKEWQDDVEKALFSRIRIDPLNQDEVSKFERYFTDRRMKYLKQFEIAVDDHPETGLWVRDNGLSVISQVMEKTGQLFEQLKGCDLSSAGRNQRSLAFILASARSRVAAHGYNRDYQYGIETRSLWEPDGLSRVTRNGIPTNVALWAIKSEFPSSLNMVTHLTFIPDCVPIAAAKRIIQVMPNLESCISQVHFSYESEEGWRDFTDFIQELRVSTPSLRKLKVHIQSDDPEQGFPASMADCAHALREASLSLEELHVSFFHLHEAFFLPFSDHADAADDTAASGSQRAWPKLKRLYLGRFTQLPSSGPVQPILRPIDIVLAAAKATLAMPNLNDMRLLLPGHGEFHVDQGIFSWNHLNLAGFSEDEERTILAAYAHLVGARMELDCEFPSVWDMGPPDRHFVPRDRIKYEDSL